MPNWMVRLYALFDGDVRANVNELGYNPHLDVAAARSLLRRAPIPRARSVADLGHSLIEHGLA